MCCMAKVASAEMGDKDGRDGFLVYLLDHRKVKRDELTVNGGLGGMRRTLGWFRGELGEYMGRDLSEKWVAVQLKEWGFTRFRTVTCAEFNVPPELFRGLWDEDAWVERAQVERNGVTREIDPEHLTQEEQADLVASQMTLRGSKTQLRGALTKLEGLMMRPNALLQPDRIDAALKEVEDLAKNARAEVAKFRKAS